MEILDGNSKKLRYCGHSTNLRYETKENVIEINAKITDDDGYFDCKVSCLEDEERLSECRCGYSAALGRIVNGEDVYQPGTYPWQAILLGMWGPWNSLHLCTFEKNAPVCLHF